MAKQNSNIDLTRVDNENLEELANRIEEFYKADSNVKSALAYNWERNHLMLDGKQWIVFDGHKGSGGQWRQLQVSKSNEYIPRPVTNYIFDIYQTLKSYLIQNKPRSTVTPNTQKWRDKQAAKLSNLVCESNWERLKEEKNYEYASACLITYGTVFKKDFWDTSSVMMASVPRMESVPETDETGMPVTDPMTGMPKMKEQQAQDPETGQPVFDEIPLGDVNTAVVEPYRIALDPLATDIHTARWIMEYSIQPIDWVLETYSREGDGYTGEAANLQPEQGLSSSLSRFVNLKTSSGVRAGGLQQTNSGSGGSEEAVENSVVLKEYYEAPSRRHPKGRLVAVANGLTLYAGPSPYSGPELGDWHPYSEARWELVPGRFWGKSPLDDATEIQKHINSIDAAIILVRKTMAVPQKLIPASSGVKPGEWTGRPGQEIRYRDGSTPPSTIPPAGVDAQVFQERAQRVEDLKNITGAVDILKGDRPPGVTAASALEMLFEVGTGKLRPALDRWKTFVESSQKKQLRWVARFFQEPRPQFIKLLKMKNEDLPEIIIENFIGSDLQDNCQVKVEAGSNIPKLQSAEKAQLLQLAQLGSLNLDNPENRMEFNHRLGVIGFDRQIEPDKDRAEWENLLLKDILASPDNQPVVLVDDDHLAHVDVHLRDVKKPSFMELDPAIQDAYMAHIEQHRQYQMQAEAMEMEKAAMTGQPPQADAPDPGIHPSGSVSQKEASQAFGLPKEALNG